MKRDWNADELAEHWGLLPVEKQLLGNKAGATRLGFAVLLKFFQHEGCFPRQRPDVPGLAVAYVARQVGVAPEDWAQGTGITNYLENGGTLGKAQAMAAHESARTTKLYDRRGDSLTLDEVERINI